MPSSGKHVLNTKRKERRKILRSVSQAMVLFIIAVIVIQTVLMLDSYEEASGQSMTNTKGFVTLSYLGVDRSGSPKYISKSELERHLSILKEQGFETISQQQVIDFYEKGKPLPEKALFLSFEDGRNDSSIFAQPVLEKLNYKATMFTYADKMDSADTKFLKPRHLKQMMNSGYWELGSNGYRLTYINVFNDSGQYSGEIDEETISDKTMIEYYNHYLMDFLRDEYMIPKETRKEMEKRIAQDYKLMNQVYMDHFSFVPKAYAIMHADALYQTMHDDVQAVNDKQIKQSFSFHFNRDVTSFNKADESLYNLNRLQVAPHWPVNHLLMKIKLDTDMPIDFATGDQEKAEQWTVANGAAEFDQDRIILTTAPDQEAEIVLKEHVSAPFTASWRWTGQVLGKQTMSLRSADGKERVSISLEENNLSVHRMLSGQEKNVFEKALPDIEWDTEEYSFRKATVYDYLDTQEKVKEEGYPETLRNDRQFSLVMSGNSLVVKVDNETIGKIPLSSADYMFTLGGKGIAGNHDEGEVKTGEGLIYDSITEDLMITSSGETIYGHVSSNQERWLHAISDSTSRIIDFFIETF